MITGILPARGHTKRPGGQSETFVEAVEGVPPETCVDSSHIMLWKSNLSKSHQFWNPEIVRIWTASIRSEIAYSAYREE